MSPRCKKLPPRFATVVSCPRTEAGDTTLARCCAAFQDVLWFAMQTGLRMVDTDPRLIRLVTRHFKDLQGYCKALAGVAMAVPGLVYVATRSDRLGAAATFCAVAVTFLPMRAAYHYYRERFGRVEQGDKAYRLMIVFVCAAVLTPLPHGVQMFWLVMAAHAAWLTLDGWPFRSHMLFEVAAALFAALTASAAPVTIQALMPGFALLGTASVITGLRDHALLVRAMRATREPEQIHADAV
jgi:hypothetical protein